MKKVIIIAFLSFSFMISQAQDSSFHYENTIIRGLVISGTLDVQLSQGDQSMLEVITFNDLQDSFDMSLSSSHILTLTHTPAPGSVFKKGHQRPLVRVIVTSLDQLKASGKVSILCKGEFDSGSIFDLTLSDGAYLSYLRLSCAQALLTTSGTSEIENVSITSRQDITYHSSGSAKSDINLYCSALIFQGSGTSRTRISGTSYESFYCESYGNSSVSSLNFSSESMTFDLIGTSRIDANVIGMARLTKSKTSRFRYIGSGTVIGEGAKKL